MSAVLLEMKARHYADWADHPLPAFGGKTAREMARTKKGRERVGVMLKTLVHARRKPPRASGTISGRCAGNSGSRSRPGRRPRRRRRGAFVVSAGWQTSAQVDW